MDCRQERARCPWGFSTGLIEPAVQMLNTGREASHAQYVAQGVHICKDFFRASQLHTVRRCEDGYEAFTFAIWLK